MIDFLRKRNRLRVRFSDHNDAGEKNSSAIINNLHLTYQGGGEIRTVRLPGDLGNGPALELDNTGRADSGWLLNLNLNLQDASQPIKLLDFSIQLQPGFSPQCTMMVNGFQSWSRSEEKGAGDRLAPLFAPARSLLAPCGDAYFQRYSGRKGHFHSWTYTFFRLPDGQIILFGSLSEKEGYTIFEYDYKSDRLLIHRDCEGAEARSGYSLLNLYIGRGSEDLLFGEYMKLVGSTRERAPKATGWCSWYNYYTRVSEKIIRDNLADLSQSKLPFDYFQVDDGWQKAIGDWLECNHKFESGMQELCSEIRAHGFRPGLWLAPFICVPSSDLYREKPGWLLRDQRGKPVRAGFNPGWEGFFYALDFYAPGFQDYLRRVFERVQDQWGYSMLKLDFLYAAALLPNRGRSRGRVMSEAIDFIDRLTGKSIVLGCGVPLGPAFGRFDYCRIGSDVGPYWEDYLKLLNYPERVATENSLVCTLGRRQLDGSAFRNDPDVYILRDGIKGINENKLNPEQRFTLFLLNNIFGGLIFLSDDLSGLSAGQMQLLRSSFPVSETAVSAVKSSDRLHDISFTADCNDYRVFANLSAHPRQVEISAGHYYSSDHFIIHPGAVLNLKPYQSICLHQIRVSSDDLFLIGADGHLFPGAQVEELADQDENVFLKLHRDASKETAVYIGLPPGKNALTVNGISYGAKREKDLNYIKIAGPGGIG